MVSYPRLVSGTFALFAAALLPASAAEVDSFLPDDAGAVVSIDVKAFLGSPLFKKHLEAAYRAQLQANPELQQLLTTLGWDPLNDLATVVAAGPPGVAARDQALVIVRGRFDLARIEAVAADLAKQSPEHVTIRRHEQLSLYEIKAKDSPDRCFAAFIDRGCLVISAGRDVVEAAIARSAGKRPLRLGKDMQSLIAAVDAKQTIWLVALATDGLKRDLAINDGVKKVMGTLRSVAGGLRVGEGIKAEVRVQTASARAAADLRNALELVRGQVALAVNFSPQLADFAPLVNEAIKSIKLTSARNTVAVEGAISATLIHKAVAKVKKP